MKLTDSVKTCFAKYASFQGTASRSEYWKFVFFCMLVGSAANLSKSLPLYLVALLVLLLPSTAVLIRRLHDTNHSGMWYFLVFTVVGVIPLFIWLCSPTVDEDNKYSLSKSRKKCPDCAEYVAIDAKKCKHCGAALAVDAEQRQTRDALQKKSGIDWGFICMLPIGLAVIAYDAYDTNSELQKSIRKNNSFNVYPQKNNNEGSPIRGAQTTYKLIKESKLQEGWRVLPQRSESFNNFGNADAQYCNRRFDSASKADVMDCFVEFTNPNYPQKRLIVAYSICHDTDLCTPQKAKAGSYNFEGDFVVSKAEADSNFKKMASEAGN